MANRNGLTTRGGWKPLYYNVKTKDIWVDGPGDNFIPVGSLGGSNVIAGNGIQVSTVGGTATVSLDPSVTASFNAAALAAAVAPVDWAAAPGAPGEVLNKPSFALSYDVSTQTISLVGGGSVTLPLAGATAGAAGLLSGTDKNKLDSIPTVVADRQADWNEATTSSDSYIQNKPSLGYTASAAKGVLALGSDQIDVPLVTTTNAGLMVPADKEELDAISIPTTNTGRSQKILSWSGTQWTFADLPSGFMEFMGGADASGPAPNPAGIHDGMIWFNNGVQATNSPWPGLSGVTIEPGEMLVYDNGQFDIIGTVHLPTASDTVSGILKVSSSTANNHLLTYVGDTIDAELNLDATGDVDLSWSSKATLKADVKIDGSPSVTGHTQGAAWTATGQAGSSDLTKTLQILRSDPLSHEVSAKLTITEQATNPLQILTLNDSGTELQACMPLASETVHGAVQIGQAPAGHTQVLSITGGVLVADIPGALVFKGVLDVTQKNAPTDTGAVNPPPSANHAPGEVYVNDVSGLVGDEWVQSATATGTGYIKPGDSITAGMMLVWEEEQAAGSLGPGNPATSVGGWSQLGASATSAVDAVVGTTVDVRAASYTPPAGQTPALDSGQAIYVDATTAKRPSVVVAQAKSNQIGVVPLTDNSPAGPSSTRTPLSNDERAVTPAYLKEEADGLIAAATAPIQTALNQEVTDRTNADAALQTDVDARVKKAGDTMTGALNVPAGASGTQAPQVQEVVRKSGDTMTGALVLNADPSQALQAATKQYVDHLIDSEIFISDTPPANPRDKVLWYDSIGGRLYIYYDDGNSKQWVEASPQKSAADRVAKSGDTMTGALTVPNLTVTGAINNNQVAFAYGTVANNGVVSNSYNIGGATVGSSTYTITFATPRTDNNYIVVASLATPTVGGSTPAITVICNRRDNDKFIISCRELLVVGNQVRHGIGDLVAVSFVVFEQP